MCIRIEQRAMVLFLAVACVPGIIKAQAPQGGARSVSVPAAVYSRLFRQVVNFEANADRLAAQGRPNTAVRHHHQIWLGLTADQEAVLKQVAADWARQNSPLDVQASSARSTLQRLRRESPSAAASQEAGLAAVAAQQVALAQSGRDSLARAFGPAGFAYFESRVRRYSQTSSALRGVRPDAVCGIPPPSIPTGEVSTLLQPLIFNYGNACNGPCSGGQFTMSLLGHGPSGSMLPGESYSNSTVQEGLSGFSDSCYYPNSPVSYASAPSGLQSSWAVTGANTYYYDDIVAGTRWVNYYTSQGNTACNVVGVAYQCGTSINQTMYISVPGYQSQLQYASGSSGVQINCAVFTPYRMQQGAN